MAAPPGGRSPGLPLGLVAAGRLSGSSQDTQLAHFLLSSRSVTPCGLCRFDICFLLRSSCAVFFCSLSRAHFHLFSHSGQVSCSLLDRAPFPSPEVYFVCRCAALRVFCIASRFVQQSRWLLQRLSAVFFLLLTRRNHLDSDVDGHVSPGASILQLAAALDDVLNPSKEGQSWILLWDLASIHASEATLVAMKAGLSRNRGGANCAPTAATSSKLPSQTDDEGADDAPMPDAPPEPELLDMPPAPSVCTPGHDEPCTKKTCPCPGFPAFMAKKECFRAFSGEIGRPMASNGVHSR